MSRPRVIKPPLVDITELQPHHIQGILSRAISVLEQMDCVNTAAQIRNLMKKERIKVGIEHARIKQTTLSDPT